MPKQSSENRPRNADDQGDKDVSDGMAILMFIAEIVSDNWHHSSPDFNPGERKTEGLKLGFCYCF
jgi:hypothetical protein